MIKKFWLKEKKKVKYIFSLFLVWRILILVFAFLGLKFVPARIDYLGGGVEGYFKLPLLWCWANFDGVHYLSIAERGYSQFQQAFFPFYPYLIAFLAQFFKDYLLSALLISHFSLLVFLFVFYKLIRLDFDQKIAKRSLFFLLVFPTAFYFGSVYTESLFLALVLGSFYAARKRKWLMAGVLGALASSTRLVGIFLFPALLIEWWSQTSNLQPLACHAWQLAGRQTSNKLKSLLPLFLISLGLLFYMWYLKITVGDPLYFIHVQPFFGAERAGDKVILLYQVFWRYLKMVLTTKLDVLYFAVWTEALMGMLFLVLSVFAYLRLRLSYFIFMVLTYLTPTLTGTFSSMPRYVLVLFPGFILLAIFAERYRTVKIVYLFLAGVLTIFSVILFTRGYWVA